MASAVLELNQIPEIGAREEYGRRSDGAEPNPGDRSKRRIWPIELEEKNMAGAVMELNQILEIGARETSVVVVRWSSSRSSCRQMLRKARRAWSRVIPDLRNPSEFGYAAPPRRSNRVRGAE
ncbi:hypothetical protein ACLB2K_023906 [Fragaria x ananassa]